MAVPNEGANSQRSQQCRANAFSGFVSQPMAFAGNAQRGPVGSRPEMASASWRSLALVALEGRIELGTFAGAASALLSGLHGPAEDPALHCRCSCAARPALIVQATMMHCRRGRRQSNVSRWLSFTIWPAFRIQWRWPQRSGPRPHRELAARQYVWRHADRAAQL